MRQAAVYAYGGKPGWLRIRPPAARFSETRAVLERSGARTVCEEAHCPNTAECWGSGTATFIILGGTCTRSCRFCAVKKGNPGGVVDGSEPSVLAGCAKKLGLRYVVITSVDRDDLADFGAAHFASCVNAVKKAVPGILVEVLTPDFNGSKGSIKAVVDSGPDVFGHNIETVRRLQCKVRDARAGYEQSLSVLAAAKEVNPGMLTKSSMMLGLGETQSEVVEAMKDLRKVGVDLLALGQYLRPGSANIPVAEYVSPERFNKLRLIGESLGFRHVASGPLVRSSYRAGEVFAKTQIGNSRLGPFAESEFGVVGK